MADIVVFCEDFVSLRFIRCSKVVINNIESIIKSHNGKELYAFSDERGAKRFFYEFPQGGCVEFRSVTDSLPISSSWVGINLDTKKYVCGAYTLFCGFKEKKDYSELKIELAIFANEVKEKYC